MSFCRAQRQLQNYTCGALFQPYLYDPLGLVGLPLLVQRYKDPEHMQSTFSERLHPLLPEQRRTKREAERADSLNTANRLSWLNLLRSSWSGGEKGHAILNDTRKMCYRNYPDLFIYFLFFGLHSKQLVELSLLAYICGSAPPCHSSKKNKKKPVRLLSGTVPRYQEKYVQAETAFAVKVLQAAGQGGIKRRH